MRSDITESQATTDALFVAIAGCAFWCRGLVVDGDLRKLGGMDTLTRIAIAASILLAGCSGSSSSNLPATNDPGQLPWELVAANEVAEECLLDPDLLAEADAILDSPWAVIRYGKLCHEYYPDGSDAPSEVYSTTKTLSAVVTGMVEYQSRNFERNGRKTGPLKDSDRVDHWLDADQFDYNPDAKIGHVLAMVAYNEDLSPGNRIHSYDAGGSREINSISDVLNTVIAQDPDRLGENLEEFAQKFLFEPLGMADSSWSNGAPDKIFGYSWRSTVRDMGRLGLLILNDGIWEGERLLSPNWIDKMTHPAFEDANTSYGYLTWLSSNSNYNFGGIAGGAKINGPLDQCLPAAIWPADKYPHGISEATDCGYSPEWSCVQVYDVGSWSAMGFGGQLIVGKPGLGVVIVGKNLGNAAIAGTIWGPLRPALIALDPVYQGDQDAFCEAYAKGSYAPDL